MQVRVTIVHGLEGDAHILQSSACQMRWSATCVQTVPRKGTCLHIRSQKISVDCVHRCGQRAFRGSRRCLDFIECYLRGTLCRIRAECRHCPRLCYARLEKSPPVPSTCAQQGAKHLYKRPATFPRRYSTESLGLVGYTSRCARANGQL
jgi:hypothetical protein